MLPAVRPWAHSSSNRHGRRRQRLRKKTDAILRMRIIMVDQLYTTQCQIGNGVMASPLVELSRKVARVAAPHGVIPDDLGIAPQRCQGFCLRVVRWVLAPANTLRHSGTRLLARAWNP
jgi:hypothetical protein